MTGTTFILDAMHDAATLGDAAAPSELLRLAADYPDPIAALCNNDRSVALFESVHKAFPFIPRAWGAGTPLSATEHAQLVSLLRWVIETLLSWKRASDPHSSQLISVFVAAQACDHDGRLWPLMPSGVADNAELVDCVSKLIASFAIAYGTRGGMQAPIWEQEALDRLKKAETDGDWAAIGDAWQPFEAQLFPNVLQIQAVRCLNRCGLAHLVKALANVRQTAVAMQLVTPLSLDERFNLALASDNTFIQFASVYQTFSGRRTLQALTPNAVQLLASVLVKVAGDSQRWSGWLHVFNAYPMRYPALQEALGLALAGVSDTAREAYVESIVLLPSQMDSPGLGRDCVAACLRAFRQNATDVQRAALWTLGYERWKKWRFNERDRNQHLFKINRSQLDYAVVGYASECLNDAELEAEMASLRSQLQSIDDQWHVSITDVITEWNCVLSMFQPFGHAQSAKTTGQDWLTANFEYWPFDFSKRESQYILARFGVEPKKVDAQP
jgi:hypothetical protein